MTTPGGGPAALALVVVLVLVLGAAAPLGARVFVDDTGAAVHLPAIPQRIVSLAPDLTRTLHDLGLGGRVVGVSDQCDDPPAVAALPRVGPMTGPSLEAIVALAPDLVLASSAGNPLAFVERLRELGLPVVGVRPPEPGLQGVAAKVLTVAAAVGRPREGRALVADWNRRLRQVAAQVPAGPPLRACWLVWPDPAVAAGHGTFLDDLLVLVQAENVCARGAESWPRLSREDLVLADPDVFVISVDGHGTGAGLPAWTSDLRAVRHGRVVRVDGDLFLRPTLALADAAERLPALLRPAPARSEGGP